MPFMLLAPVNPADELDCVAGAEDVADVCGEEVAGAEVDPDVPDDPLVVLVSTALATVMTPPPTFLGAAALALAAADL
jgi:hypothetical protein